MSSRTRGSSELLKSHGFSYRIFFIGDFAMMDDSTTTFSNGDGFLTLAAQFLEGELPDSSFDVFRQYLAEERNRSLLVDMCLHARAISELHAGRALESPAALGAAAIREDSRRGRAFSAFNWRRNPIRFSLLAVALTLAFIGLFFAVARPQWMAMRGGNHREREIANTPLPRFVARITGSFEHQWVEGRQPAGARAWLAEGDELALAAGLVEVTHQNGTRVVLEGPCRYRLTAVDRVLLAWGKIHATVPESAVGFKVVTPNAVVEDLGTEFGVEVTPEGATETVVFAGRVRMAPVEAATRSQGEQSVSDERPGRVLEAGQAGRVAGNEVADGDSAKAAGRFTRNVPGREGEEGGAPPAGWAVDSPGQAKIDWGAWPFSVRMIVPSRHNDWLERGLAPVVYRQEALSPACEITTEVVVRGSPYGSMAGPVVYDAATKQFAVQIGLHRIQESWEILLESPGQTHFQAAHDGGRVQLRLERRNGEYAGYYRGDEGQSWILLGRIAEGELQGGAPKDPRAGLLTKSYRDARTTVDYLLFAVTEHDEEEANGGEEN